MKSKNHPQTLSNALKATPQGASIEAINRQLPHMARRSLQRLLANLVQQGTIQRTGKGPATVYKLAEEPITTSTAHINQQINLSENSQQILAQLNSAKATRPNAQYQPEWLQAYTPNITYYLPESTRQQLHQQGQTAMANKPAGSYARSIIENLQTDIAFASSQLANNHYTQEQAELLIRHGVMAEEHSQAEAQQLLNHQQAIQLIVQSAVEAGYNRYTLLNLHGLLSEGLMQNPKQSGTLRTQAKPNIGHYTPSDNAQQIEQSLNTLLYKAEQIRDPFEQAFFTLVHLHYLQPFAAHNGTVARMAANIALIKNNLSPLSYINVPPNAWQQAIQTVCELRSLYVMRDVFIEAYQHSAQRNARTEHLKPQATPLAIKHRKLIHQTIGNIIKAGQADTTQQLEEQAQTLPTAERYAFIAQAQQHLQHLHEGVLARYGVRPSEYKTWKEAQAPSP